MIRVRPSFADRFACTASRCAHSCCIGWEIDIDAAVEAGRFDLINGWMRDHVFNIADRMAPSEWIRAITGRSLTPDDFLDYLESKYTALYEL